jgi:hypothetical protein
LAYNLGNLWRLLKHARFYWLLPADSHLTGNADADQ